MDLSEDMQDWVDMIVGPYWRCKCLEVYPRLQPANCLYAEKLLILIFDSHGTHHQPQRGNNYFLAEKRTIIIPKQTLVNYKKYWLNHKYCYILLILLTHSHPPKDTLLSA